MSSTSSETAGRWVGLDTLRAALLLLGLLYHASYAYVPDVGRWYFVEDSATHAAFAVLASLLHAFRMPAFMLLAGLFARLGYERRGAAGFLRERARRLLVPFALFVGPTVLADWGLRRLTRGAGLMDERFALLEGPAPRPLHLWFLLALFGLSAVGTLAAPLLASSVLRGVARWLARWPQPLVLLAVGTGAALQWVGEPLPAGSFLPEPASLLHHAPFFLLGWLWWPEREALQRWPLTRTAWVPAGVGLGAWLFSQPLQYQPQGRLLQGAVAWLVALGLLAWAARHRGGVKAPRAVAFVVDAAYWVYLVHYPVVLALQLALARLGWPAGLKYGLVVAGAAALSFGTWVPVRRSLLGALLGAK